MDIKTVDQRVDDAVFTLLWDFPFYGSIYLNLNMVKDPTCDTAWTDGTSIGWSPKFFEPLTKPEILGVIVHEILHVVNKHFLRKDADPAFKANHMKFNVAADYAINPTIVTTSGMELPDGCMINMDKWYDSLAEHIFHQLDKDDMPQPNAGDGMPGNGIGGDVRAPAGASGKPMTPAERADKAAEVDGWVKQAAQKAGAAGKIPGNMQDVINKATETQTPWDQELQHLVEQLCRDDYTWSMPNVRYVSSGIFLPTLKSESMPDLVIVVDTSGSMNDRQLRQILTEIERMLETFNVRLTIVYCDTEVKHSEEFTSEDVRQGVTLNAKGRGGTAFKPAFDWIEENEDLDPAAIIYFTDLECSLSEWNHLTEPDCCMIWGQLPGCGSFNNAYRKRVTFGTVLEIPVWG